jgi:hypothetical protein
MCHRIALSTLIDYLKQYELEAVFRRGPMHHFDDRLSMKLNACVKRSGLAAAFERILHAETRSKTSRVRRFAHVSHTDS